MEPYLGQLMLVPYTFAPSGWANCDGQLLAISSNSALFSLIGTIYGGDGETTFGLPDLRGRVPLHTGSGPGLPFYNLGQRGGSTTNTLIVGNLPAHSHTATASVNNTSSDLSVPTAGSSIAQPGQESGRSFVDTLGFNSATPNTNLNPATISVGNTGSSNPVNNMQPYLTMRYVIALVGLFPSF